MCHLEIFAVGNLGYIDVHCLCMLCSHQGMLFSSCLHRNTLLGTGLVVHNSRNNIHLQSNILWVATVAMADPVEGQPVAEEHPLGRGSPQCLPQG